MTRCKWLVVLLLALATAASAARRPPKAKPKNGRWLNQKKGLWYLLDVPKPYDPKLKYPLLVVAAYRDDRAHESFGHWAKDAQLDQIFLATLNFPPGFKDDRNRSLWDMVAKVVKEYENIDRKHLVLLGAGTGADSALQFIAAYPRVFGTSIVLNPVRYPDLSKTKPGGPRLAGSTPRMYLTYNSKDKKLLSKVGDAVRQLRRRHVLVKRQSAIPEGSGQASPEERKLAIKALRDTYSSARRKMLASAWEAEADKLRKQKEAERQKLAEARAELEGKPKPGTKPKKEETPKDPDSLWLKANELQNEKKDYAAAIVVYEKLLEIAPKSDYAAEARKRIAALKGDPQVRQTIADQDAGTECRKWMSLAGNYQRAGLNDKAIVYYTKIIEKHPDSSFAATAREELKKLKGGK